MGRVQQLRQGAACAAEGLQQGPHQRHQDQEGLRERGQALQGADHAYRQTWAHRHRRPREKAQAPCGEACRDPEEGTAGNADRAEREREQLGHGVSSGGAREQGRGGPVLHGDRRQR